MTYYVWGRVGIVDSGGKEFFAQWIAVPSGTLLDLAALRTEFLSLIAEQLAEPGYEKLRDWLTDNFYRYEYDVQYLFSQT